tara:strand:+ start:158 stop:490 length:333 start_codon:yes stop_codon:yes gene_type:complete
MNAKHYEWNNHEDTYEEAMRRKLISLEKENDILRLDLRELTKVFYKLLGDKNMTKFSDEFVQKVQSYYKEGKKQKKTKNDKVFTIEDIVEKFGILPNQAKRILYLRKGKK